MKRKNDPLYIRIAIIVVAITGILFAIGMCQAQSVTNIVWRVQVETGTVGGTTNTVTTNWRWDYGGAKDMTRVNGYVFAYNNSKSTNTLNQWIKTDVADRADSYAAVKASADYQALLAKISSLLLSNPDLLSASDLTSLNTIAAKAP